MKKALLWRVLLVFTILTASFYFLSPDLLPLVDKDGKLRQRVSSVLPEKGVNLGLDLRGGIHLTLGVELETAIHNIMEMLGQDLLAATKQSGLMISVPSLGVNDRLEFILASQDNREALLEMLAKEFPQVEVEGEQELVNGRLRFQLVMTEAEKSRLEDQIVDSVIKTISTRIDSFGVAEPDIRKQGAGRIIVQLPGLDDTKRAIAIIGKTAHLEFRLVRDGVAMNRPAPVGVEFLPFMRENVGAGKLTNNRMEQLPMIAVEKNVAMTGDRITNAHPVMDERNNYLVSLSFDNRGREIFSRLTGDNVRKQLAIVLDGVVYSAPRIEQKISGRGATITGMGSWEEAADLALILRAGSLPAPVRVLEERTVGPSLGQESIQMGITAALVGGACTILFMSIYYGMSGVVAGSMVILDVLFILAGMAMMGATLTLPGIAGIVLTIGMAVDANVLIFERIREEMQNGHSPLEAIDMGFSRAMLAIMDSNITTIFASLILYQFGTGPIRGFAVTLTLGIVASMFTAIFVSRVIFDWWMRNPQHKLSI